jgi:hypothetical protein
MTFSTLQTVKVTPKKKEETASSIPCINCFEFLSDFGIFDLSKMVSSSKKMERNYYIFSSTQSADFILDKMHHIFGEDKKLKVELQPDKYRIRVSNRDVLFVVEVFKITEKMHIVNYKKLRGSALEMKKLWKVSKAKAETEHLVFECHE